MLSCTISTWKDQFWHRTGVHKQRRPSVPLPWSPSICAVWFYRHRLHFLIYMALFGLTSNAPSLQWCFIIILRLMAFKGFPGSTVVKNLPAKKGDARDTNLFPGSGRSLGVGNGNSLQYFCLEKSMVRGAWRWVTVLEVSWTWLN